MKIKTSKKLNLPELIQHVIDKGWNSYQVTSDNGVDIYFSSGNSFFICDNSSISLDDTFTVEVEEELTEHTYFKHLMGVTKYNLFEERVGMTIEGAVRPNTSALYIIEGGAFHLIWSRESGIPEDGILEVD